MTGKYLSSDSLVVTSGKLVVTHSLTPCIQTRGQNLWLDWCNSVQNLSLTPFWTPRSSVRKFQRRWRIYLASKFKSISVSWLTGGKRLVNLAYTYDDYSLALKIFRVNRMVHSKSWPIWVRWLVRMFCLFLISKRPPVSSQIFYEKV